MALLPKKDRSRKPKIDNRRSPVNSYYRSQSSLSDSPFAAKQSKKSIRRYFLGALDIVIIIFLICTIGYSLMINSQPKVIASSLAFHSQGTYQAAAASELRHLANRNKITFNARSLSTNLQKQFPEISSVSTELPLFSERATIRLNIDPASFILSSHNQNYIVNSNGRAIARLFNLSNRPNLPVVQDQSGYRVSTSSQILSGDSVSFIAGLVAQCHRASVPVSSLTIPPIPQELDLRTKDQPYYVKFYLGGDVLTQTGQYLAARQHFKQTGQIPSQYLDVRVSGKVFYK